MSRGVKKREVEKRAKTTHFQKDNYNLNDINYEQAKAKGVGKHWLEFHGKEEPKC